MELHEIGLADHDQLVRRPRVEVETTFSIVGALLVWHDSCECVLAALGLLACFLQLQAVELVQVRLRCCAFGCRIDQLSAGRRLLFLLLVLFFRGRTGAKLRDKRGNFFCHELIERTRILRVLFDEIVFPGIFALNRSCRRCLFVRFWGFFGAGLERLGRCPRGR